MHINPSTYKIEQKGQLLMIWSKTLPPIYCSLSCRKIRDFDLKRLEMAKWNEDQKFQSGI
jgi:hypothetical protein